MFDIIYDSKILNFVHPYRYRLYTPNIYILINYLIDIIIVSS